MKNLKLNVETIKRLLKRGVAITALSAQLVTMGGCSCSNKGLTNDPVTTTVSTPTPTTKPTATPTAAPTPTEAPITTEINRNAENEEVTKLNEEIIENVDAEEFKSEYEELLAQIQAERNAQFVSFEDYEKAYVNFYSNYKDILSINSIDAFVYYMNAGSMTDETLAKIAGNYVTNDGNALINNTAIALEDAVNYNINAYLPAVLNLEGAEVKTPIKLSYAVSNPEQRATIEYLESLVRITATGTEEEALNALKQFHSIVIYKDADLENEPSTEKYDAIKYDELNPEGQFMTIEFLGVQEAVLAGLRGITFDTYKHDDVTGKDIKSDAVTDLSDFAAKASNPVYERECIELIKK